MSISIRIATSQRDLHRIFRFRYEVYVEEMQRPQHYADHSARTIIEPFDDSGHQFLAEDASGAMVGVLRTNFAHETCFRSYRDLYDLHQVDGLPAECVSITTKLMVAPAFRRGALGMRLAQAVYQFGLERGILVDFIDCNPHLEPVFEGLGYRRHRNRAQHPEYGDVQPMVLILNDLAHLEAIRSPFAKLCREHCLHHRARSLLSPSFTKHHLSSTTELQHQAA